MYRKKIAVRAMTAIAAGALLASNVMVAGATAGTVKPVEQTLTAESATETEAEEGEDSSEESAGNQEEEEKDNIPESEAEDAETEESTEAVADETEESAEEEKASTEEAETEAETDNQANVLRAPAANVMAVDETQAEENRTATLNVYLKDLDNKEPLNEGKPVVIEKEVKEGEELADFTMEDLKAEAGSLLDGYEIDKAYVEAGLPSVGADSSRDVEVGVRHKAEENRTATLNVYLTDLDNDKEPLNEGKPVVIEKEVKEGEELADFTMEDLKAEAGSLLDGYEIDKAYVEAGLPSVGADSSRDVEVGVRHKAEENRTATLNVYLTDLDNDKEPLNEGKPVVIEKEVKEGEELADFTMEDLKAEAGSLLDGYEIDKAYVEAGLPSVGADSSRDVEVGVRHQEEGLTTQIAHVQFVYNNEVIAGGDYFVMADKDGVFNYEELKQYVPEGYTFTVTGDASVKTPKIVVELTKLEEELTSQIAHVQFVYNDEVIAGGDYFVMADKDGVFNYEELKQYVPEGYTFTVTGDENVKTPQIVVELTKVEEGLTAQIAHVQFVYGDEVVAGGDYFVMADKDGVFKYEELKQYVPEGYTFTITGDASVKTPVIVVELTKNEEPTPEPEQKVTSTVTINFVYNGATMATQTFDKTGLKNDTFKVSNSVVDMTKVPSGYEIASKFEEKEYHYGENVTLTVELKRQSSNNGGGSSSGGSSGGGGTRTAAAFGSSGTLANGNWHQLDDQRWEYNYTDGTKARNGWYTLIWQDRMDWYYFDADGYLVSGWYTDANGVKYYLHAQHDGTFGRMYTGWNKVDGTWQHFNDNTEQGVYGAWEEGTPVPAELANL